MNWRGFSYLHRSTTRPEIHSLALNINFWTGRGCWAISFCSLTFLAAKDLMTERRCLDNNPAIILSQKERLSVLLSKMNMTAKMTLKFSGKHSANQIALFLIYFQSLRWLLLTWCCSNLRQTLHFYFHCGAGPKQRYNRNVLCIGKHDQTLGAGPAIAIEQEHIVISNNSTNLKQQE